jgi:uncharacterized protein YcaQ
LRRVETLSGDQARRIALAAQGFAEPRPTGRVDRRHLRKVFDRLGLVQIDSVNVLTRAQYLTLFSRLGPYDRSLLDRFVYEDHEAFEYWGHEASLIRADLHPLFRWRMAGEHRWSSMRGWAAEHRELMEGMLDAVLRDGPLSAGDLDHTKAKKGPWWGWGDTKRALEHLFHEGQVGAIRRGAFERAYCDPSKVVPPAVLARPVPVERDALVALLEHAARGHGIGTAKDLADYFRLPIKQVRPLLEEMTGEGLLLGVAVDGWKDPAYLHPAARLPRRVDACALVSPFDSMMWARDRVERLFDFTYRIEIYVPKPKRVHGYYVLPFLLGDRYVARVDLKADRGDRRLLVQSAFAEPGVDDLDVAERLHGELRTLAEWLDLDDVVVADRGDLAPALRAVASTA